MEPVSPIMNKSKFAQTLLLWIKDFLSWVGIPRQMLDKADEILFLIVIVATAFLLAGIIHKIIVHVIRRILRHRNIPLLRSLIQYRVIRKITALLPPLTISALLPFAFDERSEWFTVGEKITWVYFSIVLIFSLNAVLNTVGDTLRNREQLQNRPLKGFIQIFQVLFTCIIIVVIISILVNKSPFNLITGLGAFAAIVLLVFRDAILGLVAGVLISQNDLVRLGDWIEMTDNNVNGVVTDITLTIVKVQNFDNTIVSVPSYSLVSGSFTNWRGMSDSGGRRIMREFALKLDCIKPCTPEFLERMKAFDPELGQYITRKQQQAAEGRVANTANPAGLKDGTIDTNAGLFRAYMAMYLDRHPFVNRDLLMMVRTMVPTENGLPMQVYCFSANKDWPRYESIQSEIMEHFASVLPAFGLYAFQRPDARDVVLNGLIESGKVDLSALDGMPWHTVPAQNKNG